MVGNPHTYRHFFHLWTSMNFSISTNFLNFFIRIISCIFATFSRSSLRTSPCINVLALIHEVILLLRPFTTEYLAYAYYFARYFVSMKLLYRCLNCSPCLIRLTFISLCSFYSHDKMWVGGICLSMALPPGKPVCTWTTIENFRW